MALPNFLIIGAGRSGTTSLYHYLRQHPQIFMSRIKETNYFACDGERDAFKFPIRTLDAYEALFSKAVRERAIGEASVIYLVRRPVVDRVKEHIPDAKLIAILRDPAERAYASYLDDFARGDEKRDFAQVIRDYQKGTDVNTLYVSTGLYHSHLTRYLSRFRHDQLLLCLYDDLKRDPMIVLRQIFDFLEVAEDFVPNTAIQYNPTGLPRSRILHAIMLHTAKARLPDPIPALGAAIRRRNLVKPTMPAQLRQELIAVYREDILRLQNLIQRDLMAWLL